MRTVLALQGKVKERGVASADKEGSIKITEQEYLKKKKKEKKKYLESMQILHVSPFQILESHSFLISAPTYT